MAHKSPLEDWTAGRQFHQLEVTKTLSGAVTLPLHIVTGETRGPTLLILAAVHGDETTPAIMIRELLEQIDCASLKGRVCAVPVSNPPATGAFSRQTPEQHGKTDMHEVFPGNPNGNLTQMIASVLAHSVIDYADVLIDYHCGGSGGRLQERVDIHKGADPEIRAASLELARCFNTVLVHDNALGGTAVAYANSKGKRAFNAETGGVYLAPVDQDYYIQEGVAGFINVLRNLGMLAGEKLLAKHQLLFATQARHEANPKQGGYLVSEFQSAQDLGQRVSSGTLLGTLIDLHSLEMVEELRAPVDGYLVFARYSGAIDAGTKAFALAEDAKSEWLPS